MPTPTISRLRPLLAERGLGITLVEALFSDNRPIRFRVLSRDPAAVRAVAEEELLRPLPAGSFESSERDRSVQPQRDRFCQFSRPSGGPSYSASDPKLV